MKKYFVAIMMCAAIVGALAFASPAAAKSAKECRAEWTANKAANQAKGVAEKAYVDRKAGTSAEKPKAEPAAAAAKDKTPAKTAAAPAKKTTKECRAEWTANKATNQAKGITEKAYIDQCKTGTAAMTAPAAPAQTKMAPPKVAPAETKMAPPKAAPVETKMAPPAMAPAKPWPNPNRLLPQGSRRVPINMPRKAKPGACPTGTVVWANLNSKIFHFAGHADYGHTKNGAYMCETDATAQGMRAAKNEKQP